MKQHFYRVRNRGIQQKFGLLLLGFALSALINYGSISYFRSQQRKDTMVVDAAGRNRMLSQKIGFLAERIVTRQEAVKDELAQAITLHNTSLNALKLGGEVPGISDQRLLPPTATQILPTLWETEALWKKYKQAAEVIVSVPIYVDAPSQNAAIDTAGPVMQPRKRTFQLNPSIQEALTFIEQNAPVMLAKNDALVKSYVRHNQNKQRVVDAILLLLLLVDIALIGVAVYMIRKYIVRPAQSIQQMTQQLARGNLSATSDYEGQDEIGQAVAHVNTMTQNLKKISEFAHAIGDGQFDTHFEAMSEADTLGSALLHMRDRLQEVAEEDRKRKWAAEGLAHFSNLMQGEQEDVVALAHCVLKELIQYVGANQGALFTVRQQEEEPYLELSAVYAWGRQKYAQKQVKREEDLLGQAWAEEETVYLLEIPEDYVEITSGIGKANPRSLLIVPLKVKGTVFGMLEMASLKEYEPYQLAFIERLAEGIGSALASVASKQQTQHLLESSQRQAEIMVAQEEMMRQHMEELSATQEEMIRKEQEYQRIIEEAQRKALVRLPEEEESVDTPPTIA